MTDYQNELVMEHLDLVNWVIRTRISVPNRPLLTYDDFYAIGCEAICRAALKYQADSGEFAPFACRYIYNAIIDHCRAMNYRLQRSVDAGFEEGEVLFDLLAHSVSSALRDRRQGGKQTGLLIGKRLNQHALHRTDGRIFYNSRLPTEPINLSVGLLIDESGSMCSNDRITRARATAIVIQDFCESLGIPLLVVGHTAWSSHVELFSYSDFDTYDKNNRYRLMDMSARDCNRDGAALRFVAEKLSKQTSEVKILMIICDGQPNDDGYSGSAAEADLRGIKLEYARKGVKIYAAAIGEDRPRIERIYGDGYLDITNLQELPVMLTNLIVRSLPR